MEAASVFGQGPEWNTRFAANALLGIGVTAATLNEDEHTIGLMISPALAEKATYDGNVILNANDTSLGANRVGVGSFNDTAYFVMM